MPACFFRRDYMNLRREGQEIFEQMILQEIIRNHSKINELTCCIRKWYKESRFSVRIQVRV